MLLSIIVPVYNVSKYLTKCLDSLICQDLQIGEYEVIVVDDGSTDDSGLIADKYAKSHTELIRVIHQNNIGLGGARNRGIKLAKGKYIQFVDSDDYLEPNVLKTLVDKIETDNLDILRFNYQNVNENYEVYDPNEQSKQFVDYRDEVCDGLTFLNERLGYGCYACQFVIRADLIINGECLFKEGIYFEDTDWTPRILVKSNRVTSTDLMVYNYLLRQGSITNGASIEKKRKVIEDKFLLIGSLKQQMSDKYDIRWYEGMIATTIVSLLGLVVADFFYKKVLYLRRLRELGVYPLSTYHATIRAIRKIRIINISPLAFCWIAAWKNDIR